LPPGEEFWLKQLGFIAFDKPRAAKPNSGMNYRHSYHAGNFADVFKHVWLTRLLIYLKRKDAPFRYLDTHAGIGRYDLTAEPAERTGEWRGGIGLLSRATLSRAA
jgi:23S rRNA (adenine2030-N6)-methyltransferase